MIKMYKLRSVAIKAKIVKVASQYAFDMAPNFFRRVTIAVTLKPEIGFTNGSIESLAFCFDSETSFHTSAVYTPVKCETCEVKNISTFW